MITRKRWEPDEIKALRKRMKLTQAEFAERLGYSRRGTVTDLEKGRYAPSGPAMLHLDRLAREVEEAADVEVDELPGMKKMIPIVFVRDVEVDEPGAGS